MKNMDIMPTKTEIYRIRCAKMKPEERLKKCFELSEFSKKMNKNIDIEIKRRSKNYFCLK
jgi:hypothetical protein